MNNLPSIDGLFYDSFSDGYDDGMPKTNFDTYLQELKRVGSQNLKKLVDKLSDEDHAVTFLIYTLLLPWAADVARDCHVPSAFLAIQSATANAIYNHLFSIKNDGVYSSGNEIELTFPLKLPELPLFSRNDIPTFLLHNDPHFFVSPVMREHVQNLEHDPNPRVLINTFEEFEHKSLKLLEEIGILSIGPLIPSAFTDGNELEDKSFGCDLFEKCEGYSQWLASKAEGSVVYVSFGSLAVVKEEQKEEVLKGLVESERPFLWVIRSSKEDEKNKKKNDEDYELIGNGMIVPWCSQMEVLFHKSIGCFVSHCGWNSTLESTVAGVPLIGFPQFSDQMTNIKMVEEFWGTGVRARAEEGIVKGEELKKCLEIVMGDGEKGNEIRSNVKKYRYLAMDAVKVGGSSHNNLNKFLESL